jgi:hypothetical protein
MHKGKYHMLLRHMHALPLGRILCAIYSRRRSRLTANDLVHARGCREALASCYALRGQAVSRLT